MSKLDMGNVWVIYLFKGDGSFSSFGHVSLGMPNTVTYISFYPEGKDSLGQFSGKKSGSSSEINMGSMLGCAGSFLESYSTEKEHYGKDAKHKMIYGLDSEKMVQWWDNFRQNPTPYHITNNNCAVVVYNALCEGNEWFKDDQHARTPENVFKLVKAYKKKQAELKRCKGSCCRSLHLVGSSLGSCRNVISGKR